jgi:hypothetical protein
MRAEAAKFANSPVGEIGELTQLAQSELQMASRFVAAVESNQAVGCARRAVLGV